MRWLCVMAMGVAMPAFADMVVPSRTIRAYSIIEPGDLTLRNGNAPGSVTEMAQIIGQEARVVLYPGRPIRPDDVGPPAIVSRNQVVRLAFAAKGLRIATDGRALERGAVGDVVRIMNLSSRATLFGQVQPDGSILVRP